MIGAARLAVLQEIAGDRDVQIISADIARQALDQGLIDELQVFVAPVFLGDGIRIFDVPGGRRIDWELVDIYEESPPQLRPHLPPQRISRRAPCVSTSRWAPYAKSAR